MARREDCVDALRLSESDQRAILDALELAGQASPASFQRRSERYVYNVRGGILVHPEGARIMFIVRPRNLSAGGLAFLHGSFLYPGSACSVTLQTLVGDHVPVGARIVRCRCVRGRVHEIGLRFDHPIDITKFVDTGSHTPAAAAGTGANAYDPRAVVSLAQRLTDLALDRAPMDQLRQAVADLVALLRQASSSSKSRY